MKPGYINETVKTYKSSNPLRSIISQVTTPILPTYKNRSKITLYLSHNYHIKSTHELIEIHKTHNSNKGIMSSLDAENLFTNVPVLETINIFTNNISHHPKPPSLKINSNTLRKILLLCTTEVLGLVEDCTQHSCVDKSWRQHPTRHQLYGHLPPITKTIQVRRTRHAGHCWRSRDELIRDVLLWIPTHGRAKAGRPARTYIQQLCEDTGCCPEDLPRAMNDREEWRKRVRDIRAASTI